MLIASSPEPHPPSPEDGGPTAVPLLKSGEAHGPRLLYLATSKNDGGVERYSVKMASELHRRGHSLFFACLPGEIIDRRCQEAGPPTFPFRSRNSGDLRAALRLADLLVAERIDLVHVHSRRDYVPAVLGVMFARRRQRCRSPRLVLHAHMLRALGEPPRLSGRLFGRTADAVFAVSSVVREHLLQVHRLPPTFVRLLHNGVDLNDYARPDGASGSARREAVRREFGITPESLVIGMVGRLDAKGQARLLEVAPALIAQFPVLRFVLVGAEGEPGELDRLRKTAEAGGFGGRLVFTGPREDIPSLMASFDVLAHLPLDEAFGLALVEAMAAGLPTVATDIGGCREVVRDGETGALVPPDDPAALTQALSHLLAQPDLRREQGGNGRLVAERDFAFECQINRLTVLYDELCPRPLPLLT